MSTGRYLSNGLYLTSVLFVYLRMVGRPRGRIGGEGQFGLDSSNVEVDSNDECNGSRFQ